MLLSMQNYHLDPRLNNCMLLKVDKISRNVLPLSDISTVTVTCITFRYNWSTSSNLSAQF